MLYEEAKVKESVPLSLYFFCTKRTKTKPQIVLKDKDSFDPPKSSYELSTNVVNSN